MNHALMAAFILVLFVGVFVQITMMARLSSQNKQLVSTQREIQDWSARVENLQRNLDMYSNHDRIVALATQLGMRQPEGSQLRVVNLPGLVEATTAQSADSSGAEEVMD